MLLFSCVGRHGVIRRLGSQFLLTAARGGLTSALYWSAFCYLRVNTFVGFVRDPRADLRDPAAHPDASFEVWTADDMRRWRADHRDAPTQCFRDTVDGVSTAMIARIDGELAAFIWLYREGNFSRMFRIGPTDAELNHGIVLPEYRSRRLFAPLLSHACAWLATQGGRRVYAVVHTDNGPSLRSFRAAGFAEFARQTHLFAWRPKFKEPDPRVLAATAAPPVTARK